MGYYSEIGLCLTPEGYEQLKTAVQAEQDENIKAEVQDLLNQATFHTNDSGTVAYHWDWMKWYSDFPDVNFIENFIDSLNSGDYLFIRLGEAGEDTECRGDFWHNTLCMGMERRVVFDAEVH